MKAQYYFQQHKDYFWQWEDDGETIAIPNGSTIAYRKYAFEVLHFLTPQGIPSWGSLLLAIIGTNGKTQMEEFFSLKDMQTNPYGAEAANFLRVLNDLPDTYKKGKNRLLVFQAIFKDCHNIMGVKKAKILLSSTPLKEIHVPKVPITSARYVYDFRTIAALDRKFKKPEDIIEQILNLPRIDEAIVTENEQAPKTADFVAQLIDNDKGFKVGALVKRIWSGLNIPLHSKLPSQQPLGGVSDLTNKGDFDKLLISEFANDDLVLLSRLANDEALYIQREIPPQHQNRQRIILIDTSLKNWGTPKIVAFATMLAIAKHPKTDIPCEAFVIGSTCHPIDITTAQGLIDGLQMLEPVLDASKGLEAFIKASKDQKNQEIFVVTSLETLREANMLRAVQDYGAAIAYWIYTDAKGNIDVYKKQQNGKKHLQHLLLPLKDLWGKTEK